MASAPASSLLRHIHQLVTVQSLAHVSDRALLRRFATERDDASFATILSRHGPMVWRACRRVLHNEHEAEDAFQATFLVLARKAGSSRWHESVANWLYQVALRMAQQAKTSILRRQAHESKMKGTPSIGPVGEITLREAQALLDEELIRLPERLRAPLVLCYLDGATRDEAARQLGLSLGTLKRRLESGRKLLRVRLTRRGLTLSATLLAAAVVPSVARAAVPAALAAATVKAALAFTAGNVAAGVVAPEVAKLVEGMTHTLWVTKLKVVATLVLTVGLLTASAGFAAHRALTAEPPQTKTETPPPLAAKEGKGGKPADDKEARVDRFGDPLPEGALARMGTVRMRHGGSVRTVAFAGDGKSFISGGLDGMVYQWETASGKRLRQFAPKVLRGVTCAALSRDGAKIAAGDHAGFVQLFDAATGEEIVSYKGHDESVTAVDFSPDGNILASIGGAGAIRLWNAATGKEVRSWKAHADIALATTCSFSRDGKTLLSVGEDAGNSSARLWDPETGKELHRIGGTRESSVASAAFTPDGKSLVTEGTAGKHPRAIQLWDVATGELLKHFADVEHVVFKVAVAPDGKTVVATGYFSGDCTLWDMATGKVVGRIKVTHDSVYSVAFSPDSKRVLLGCRDNSLHLYDIATEKDVFDFASHGSFLTAIAFTADGKGLVTGSFDKSIRLWESATGRPVRLFEGVDAWISSLALSPDDKLLAAGTVQLKDKGVKPLRVRFWDMTTGKELSPVEDTQGDVWSVAFAPDGKSVAARGTDGTVRLWDVATRKERCRLECKIAKDDSSRVVFSPDSKMVASRKDDEALGLWDAATGKLVREFRAPQKWLGSLSFSADGRTLAVGGGSTEQIRLWEVATGKLRRKIACDPMEGRVVALSPDGRALAADAHIKGTRLWDLPSGLELGTFDTFAPECLVFSPDGLRLASAESNGTALVWDVTRFTQKGRPVVKVPPDAKPDALWADLTGDDAEKAYQAIWVLAADPRVAVPLLKDHVRPAAPVDRKRLTGLIADLDNKQFETREEATRELDKLVELAEPALRDALAGKPSAEARKRIEQLLEGLSHGGLPLEQERALEVLEQAGGTEARQVLESLAKGAPEARLTKLATAALERLAKRSSTRPR